MKITHLVLGPALIAVGARAQPIRRNLDLETCVKGPQGLRVVLPEDEDYDASRHQFASQLGNEEVTNAHLHPMMIAYCESVEDVKTVVTYAKKCDYKISVRSGGHQYSGYSSCEEGTRCLQLDMSGLTHYIGPSEENGFRVTLGVGLKLGDVFTRLSAVGRIIPTGICSTVGVGGHYQSSALGQFQRSFGSGLDWVVSFRIVKADGTVLTVTRDSDEDLYWAVLGGAPGSWGVILDYTLDTILFSDYPHSRLIRFVYIWSPENFKAVSNKMLEISAKEEYARDFLAAVMVRTIDGNPSKYDDYTHFTSITISWVGVDHGEMTDEIYAELVQPFKEMGVIVQAEEPPYVPLHFMWGAIMTPYDYHGEFRYHEHTMTDGSYQMDDGFIEVFASELERRMQINDFYTDMQIFSLGASGKGSQIYRNGVDGDAYKGNAYAGRNIKVFIDDWQFFKHNEMEEEVASKITEFRKVAAPYFDTDGKDPEHLWMSTHTVDAFEAEMQDEWKDYFPSRKWFHRLQKVKAEVDPCNTMYVLTRHDHSSREHIRQGLRRRRAWCQLEKPHLLQIDLYPKKGLPATIMVQ